MISTQKIFEQLKTSFPPEPAECLSRVLSSVIEEHENSVIKAEFNEFRQIIKALVDAQKAAENRLSRLEIAVHELAEAQKRTEAAVRRVAEQLRLTNRRIDDTNKQLGGLSAAAGYTLENEAMKHLPRLLQRDWNIQLAEAPYRSYLEDSDGRPIEVNIIARGKRNGQQVLVIGESKVQLSKKHINSFLNVRIKQFGTSYGELFPVIVAHMTREPDTRNYAKSKNVAVYLSYEFER